MRCWCSRSAAARASTTSRSTSSARWSAAASVGAAIYGVVGSPGGTLAELADVADRRSTPPAELRTPLVESFQAVVWHGLVSHPAARAAAGALGVARARAGRERGGGCPSRRGRAGHRRSRRRRLPRPRRRAQRGGPRPPSGLRSRRCASRRCACCPAPPRRCARSPRRATRSCASPTSPRRPRATCRVEQLAGGTRARARAARRRGVALRRLRAVPPPPRRRRARAHAAPATAASRRPGCCSTRRELGARSPRALDDRRHRRDVDAGRRRAARLCSSSIRRSVAQAIGGRQRRRRRDCRRCCANLAAARDARSVLQPRPAVGMVRRARTDLDTQDLRRRRRPRRDPGAGRRPAHRRLHDEPDADVEGGPDRLRGVRPAAARADHRRTRSPSRCSPTTPTRCAGRRARSPRGARTSTSRSRSPRPRGESMAPLVRELSEDGVKVNVTALFTTAQVELITAAVEGRRAVLHLGVRRPDRRRGHRPGADHGPLGRDHGRGAPRGADLGLARARSSTSSRPTRSAATSSP